jgi:hypothetical protein
MSTQRRTAKRIRLKTNRQKEAERRAKQPAKRAYR